MNKVERFLNSIYPVKTDQYGVPSIIVVEGVEKTLVQSIDRKGMLTTLSKSLISKMGFSVEESKKLSQNYLDTKYGEYVKFLLNS